MKTEKHIDWEEVKKYHLEHPIGRKEYPKPSHRRRWKKKPSTLLI